jgi:hypothetical protein
MSQRRRDINEGKKEGCRGRKERYQGRMEGYQGRNEERKEGRHIIGIYRSCQRGRISKKGGF